MSRIAKNPITIPEKTTVNISNNLFTIKGNHGEMCIEIPNGYKVEQNENLLKIGVKKEILKENPKWGTLRSLVANAVIGVSEGFVKELEMIGVGYQATIQASCLKLQRGFSHDLYFDLPSGITINIDRNILTVAGIDKQLVGAVAAKIRSFRKPEPYKGKGIRYRDEYVRTKQGKTVGGIG